MKFDIGENLFSICTWFILGSVLISFTFLTTNAVSIQYESKNKLTLECVDKYKDTQTHPADVKFICGTIN